MVSIGNLSTSANGSCLSTPSVNVTTGSVCLCDDLGQDGREPFRLLDVGGVAALLEDDLVVRAAGNGVSVEHASCLRDHGLWWARLCPGSSWDEAEAAQMRPVGVGAAVVQVLEAGSKASYWVL